MSKIKDAIERGEFLNVDAQMKKQAETGGGDNFSWEDVNSGEAPSY